MTLGEPSGKAQSTPCSAQDDATLDIVRLLVETEARYVAAQQARGVEVEDSAGAAPAGGFAVPQPLTLKGVPRQRGQPLPPEMGELGEVEDLRPYRLGMRLPLWLVRGPSAWRARWRRERRPGAGGLHRWFGARLAWPLKRAVRPRRAAQSDATPVPRGRLRRRIRLVAFGAAVVVIWAKPWLVPVLLFMALWLVLIGFLVLGSARVSEVFALACQAYQRRWPASAARVVLRLQAAADRLDGLLARLPARISDGVYTPDLGRSARDLAREGAQLPEADPYERLHRQRTAAE